MTQYHANSRPDMEALIDKEGDALRRIEGFKLPKFVDMPEDYKEPEMPEPNAGIADSDLSAGKIPPPPPGPIMRFPY